MVIDIYKSGYVAPVINSQATRNGKRENPHYKKTNQTRPSRDSFSSTLERKLREDLKDKA